MPLVAASELAVCLDRSRWLPRRAFYSARFGGFSNDQDHDSDDDDFDLASGNVSVAWTRVRTRYEGRRRRVDVGGGPSPPQGDRAGLRGKPRRTESTSPPRGTWAWPLGYAEEPDVDGA